MIEPGESFVYEFDAEPFGLHLYHCHVGPLAEHIARGMYGTFIIDPPQDRPPADELVMVMHGYNTTFDGRGQPALRGQRHPVPLHARAGPGEAAASWCGSTWSTSWSTTRSTASTCTANFFDYYPTGTRLEPVEYTDTVVQAPGQRGICELRFPHPGASCSTRTRPSSPTSAGWASSR